MGFNFEQRDLDLLEKTMKLRERMMDNIALKKDQELPAKPSEIMAVTNLLESIDRTILSKAKVQIDGDSAKNEEATKELLKQLILDIHSNPVHVPSEHVHQQAQIPTYTSNNTFALTEGELIPKSDNYIQEL